MTRRLGLAAIVLVSALAVSGRADVRLPTLLGDHAVLQQQSRVRLWGWAEPNEPVTIQPSWPGDAVGVTTGADGRWEAYVATPAAGGPFELAFTGQNTITLHDILVGEVWVCSGQSNMEMPLARGYGWGGVLNHEQEVAAAQYPRMRLFKVNWSATWAPKAECYGKWQACTPDSAALFSAAGYYFARRVQQDLNVPIGLIQSTMGGTRAEAWTSREMLESLGLCTAELATPYIDKTPENVARYQAAEGQREARRYELDAHDDGLAAGYARAEFDDSGFGTLDVPGRWEDQPDLRELDGVVWFRRPIDLPEAWRGRDLVVSLGPVADCDVTYFNGRKLGSIGYGTPRYWEAPREYFIPGGFAQADQNVLAVRVFDDGGDGGLVGKPDQLWIAPADARQDRRSLAGLWRYKVSAVLLPNPVKMLHENSPTVLYNGMIAPLTRYTIRGFLWYQGEANHTQGRAYARLLPALIQDWRRRWGLGDLPFYYVQIAPYRYDASDAAAELRESQLLSLQVPNTGMVVTTDVGDPNDIHPANKQAVGERLARWALARTYGRKVEVSGPLYRRQEVEAGRIRLQFDHVGAGLVAPDGKLGEFTIAGADGKFVPAGAVIDGATVVVSSQDLPQPVAVRYGWSNTPRATLFNQDGLPASPFRTDAPDTAAAGESRPIASKPDATVQLDFEHAITDPFFGVGVQWASYPWFEVSSADWDKICRRLEFMRLPVARVMLDAFWYCRGFDAEGAPIYGWNTPYMRKLCQLLDWCEAHHVTVILGEWGRPLGRALNLASTDPRWTQIVGGSLDYLLREKKYTCIRYYNLINEPHGEWSHITPEDWRTALLNLGKELEARGLDGRITLSAPDGDSALTLRTLKDREICRLIGCYDEHWYVVREEVRRGLLELYTREQLRQMRQYDPGKPFVLGEIGLMDGKTPQDQNPDVYKFWYGVAMADAAIQFIRGGGSGLMAWDLDDAMYFLGDGDEFMNDLSENPPADAYARRKIWGMWNILGAENGHPEDEHMRPWFYAWSVLARSFPPGCHPVAAEVTGIPGLRVAAARLAPAGASQYSVAIVNHDRWPRTLRLSAPQATQAVTLVEWAYVDADEDNRVDVWPESVTKDGRDLFPVPAGRRTDVRLADGLTLQIPAQAVIVWTTQTDDALEAGAKQQ
jgi:sialate O-acetylesterase